MRSPLSRTVSLDGGTLHSAEGTARNASTESPESPESHDAAIARPPQTTTAVTSAVTHAPMHDGDPALGGSIGPYDLFGVLGRGATSIVYEARHRTLGRRVALKVMQTRGQALHDSARAADRFMREGRAAAAVRHPNVVDVFDAGTDGGRMYMAMEVVDGPTLAAVLVREGALHYERVTELLLPVVSAIAELHAAGVVHRDLKPANILLARDTGGEIAPKVADFGLSRLDDDLALTASGAILGTLAYMAPEQLRGAARADERSDQYALGVILYECLTAQLPFDSATLYERLQAALTTMPRPPSELRSRVPSALDAVVSRALHREPALRFASVDDLGAALLSFASPPVRARWAREFTAGRGSRVARPAKKIGWKAIVGGVASLAIAFGIVVQTAKPTPKMASDAPPVVPPEAPIAVSRALAEHDEPMVSAPLLPAPMTTGSTATPSHATTPSKHKNDKVAPAPSSIRESGENGAPIIDPD